MLHVCNIHDLLTFFFVILQIFFYDTYNANHRDCYTAIDYIHELYTWTLLTLQLSFMHVCTGALSQYLATRENRQICEVQKCMEEPRSWFIGDSVQTGELIATCIEH